MNQSLVQKYAPLLLALVLPLSAGAAEKKAAGAPPAASAEAPAAAEKAATNGATKVPYHGTISSVDSAAKSFTLKGRDKDRVFGVSENTKILRDGVAVELSALSPGDEVRGQVSKTGDKWEAVSVLTGEKTPAAKTKKQEIKSIEGKAEPKK
jgi:hypothetical protein